MNVVEAINELNSTVFCRLGVSSIHGVGVIAVRDIPKGTNFRNVCNVRQYSIPLQEFRSIKKEIREIILDRNINSGDAIFFIHPNADADLVSFMNHSDTPNSDGRYALRDIEAGEEVTEDFRLCSRNPNKLARAYHNYIQFNDRGTNQPDTDARQDDDSRANS